MVLKGIAGSPGVAVGPALVIGDPRAVYTRKHIHSAQMQGEIERVHDAVEVAAAIRGLRPVNPETTIQVEGGIEQPPMEPLPRNQALWRLARDLGRRLGLELDEAAVGGASDGNTTSQYTATLDGLGAVGDGAPDTPVLAWVCARLAPALAATHATHEHALISQLVERCALLVLLLLAPLSGGSQDAAEHRQAGVVLSEEQP